MAANARNGQLLLAALAIALLFPGLGMVPLFDKDEGAFSEATREMVQSGNYLMTFMDGEPRYHKPILIYWFQALSVHLFGFNEFAVRFPSAVASAVWIVLVYRFTRHYWGRSPALWAGFFMVTAVETTIVMKAAIADALLNALIAATMFSCYRFFESGQKKALYIASVTMALGFLTKGPIAVFIPLATALAISVGARSFTRLREAAANPWAWICFFGVAAPWYIAAIIDQGRPFIEATYQHNFGRYGESMEGHGGPIYYYVLVVLIGFLPFTALLVLALGDAATPWARWLRARLSRSAERPRLEVAPVDQFLVYWFLIVFVFFSFSATKLPHYVVYGYSPLFILMARRIDRLPGRAMLIGPAVVLLLLFTALSFALPVAATYFDDPFAQDVMRGAVDDFGAVYFAGSIAALVAVLLCMALPRLTMPVRLVITGTVTAVYLNAVFMPAAARVLQAPVVRAAAIATAEGYDVKLHAVQTPSFNFYTGRLSAKGPIQPGDIVFSKTRKLDELGRYEVIYQDNGLTLARITSLSGDDSN